MPAFGMIIIANVKVNSSSLVLSCNTILSGGHYQAYN